MRTFDHYDKFWEGKWDAVGAENFVCDLRGDVYTAYLMDIFEHYGRDYKRITDLGCGTGGLVPVVKQLWPEAAYTGYDICSKAIEHNRARWPEYQWVHMTAPFIPPNSCDLLVCISVFTHISVEDTEHYLDVIREALTDDGLASLSIHTHNGKEDWVGQTGDGCMFHRPDYFEGLLVKHGWRITGWHDARQRQYEVVKC